MYSCCSGTILLQWLQESLDEELRHRGIITELTATFPAETTARWTAAVLAWEKDKDANLDPYTDPVASMSHSLREFNLYVVLSNTCSGYIFECTHTHGRTREGGAGGGAIASPRSITRTVYCCRTRPRGSTVSSSQYIYILHL